MMVWGCFAASWPGQFAIIEGNMNSALYQKILRENVQSSVCDLCNQAQLGSAASSPLNGSKGIKLRFWSGFVKVLTRIPLR
ncbi:hypothetical protein LDENG_00184740 [Lucifuga dentata]|nr:hypothetical protein LDENG_00184740 [Lucifuga dentata]